MAPSSDWVDEYNPFSTTTSEQISHLDPAPLTDTFSLCDEDEDLIQSLLPRPLDPENPSSELKGSSSPQDKQITDWLRDAEAQDVLWQNYPHPKELEICEPDCPDSIREIVVQSLKSRHAAPAAELLPTLPELVSPINSELATEDDVRYSAKIAIQVNGDDELSAYRNEENTRIETAASSARSSRSSLNINVGSSSKRRPSAQSETSQFSASSNGTCSTKSSRLAMSPLGLVALEGRYAPPRLESPYGLKIKKFFKDRKGEGECASCLDDMKAKKLVSLDCQHKYCAPCFGQLISTSMSNENYFPPKCCLLEIPTKVVHANITSQQKDLFKSKAQEYAVPAGQRWYCPHTDCTKWIPVSKQPSRTENLRCPHCKKSACTVCRGAAHLPGADCPQDFGLEATLDESERNGWKRCYKCRAMVELTLGCRHIRCKCRAEFCYVCTAPWRTCSCTEMDQARQQAEIESRRQRDDVEARETAEAIRAVEEAQRVEDEMRELDERIRRIEKEERMRADAARREEEESRKRVQAEHERAALVDKFASLRRDLDSIQSAQREAIGRRHIRELSEVVQQRAASKSKANKGQEGERQRLRRDNEEAMRVLEERQAQELEALERRHEEEEDDYFLGIRAHLRGKANREARERAAVEKVRRVQAEDKARTLSEHKAALRHAHLDDQKLAEALSALEAGRKAELEHEERWLRERQQHIAADIRWFEAIEAERLALLRQREHEALNPGVSLIDSSSPSAPLRQLKLDSSVSTAAHAQPRPTMQPPPRSVARPPPSFPSLPPPSSTPSLSSPLLLQPSPQPQPILAAIDIENPWREDGTRHRAELSSSTSLRRSQMVRRPRKSSSSSSATSASAEQNMLAEKTTPVDERPLSSLKELKGALSDMPPPPSPVSIKPRHPVRAMQHADDVNAIAYWATPRWSRGPERTRL